jgi:predicted Zn-dependent protease
MNAFAVPGGFIVVFSGLLERTETPGQFAGVLAHELQHVLKRHTTKAIIEQASTSLLLAVIGGRFFRCDGLWIGGGAHSGPVAVQSTI